MSRKENFSYTPDLGLSRGSETVTLSDVAQHKHTVGFVSHQAGTLAYEMADGSTGSIPVIAGIQYAGEFTKFMSTGSTDVTNITVFF